MDEDIARLEHEFCPPIDTALFHAIVLDFDLDSAARLQDARQTRNEIKAYAEAEEASGFDPSGSSSLITDLLIEPFIEQGSPKQDESVSRTTDTDITSPSGSGRSSALPECGEVALDSRIEALSFEEKQALLVETFPSVAEFTISHALRKADGSFEKTIDELLTVSFFVESETSDGERFQVPKGIEGFAQNQQLSKTKGRRRKDRKTLLGLKSTLSSNLTAYSTTSNVTNKWDRANQEISFLSQRVKLPSSTIRSHYHAEAASLSKTIIALAEDEHLLEMLSIPADVSIEDDTLDLVTEFPSISANILGGVIQMTYPSIASAHEIAKAIIRNPFPVYEEQTPTQILPSYARPSLEQDGTHSNLAVVSSPHGPKMNRSTMPTKAAMLATSYQDARQHAFAKATAAYRKSRSNPLMGGAASYYASVGRDAHAMAEIYSAEAADALVARQSTSTNIDLHGIDVKNAVRIALEKVQQWWTDGAAEWAREGGVTNGSGFSIVTGLGRHSQGGKARIAPAVRKALLAEGWRVDDSENGGVLLIRGKLRR